MPYAPIPCERVIHVSALFTLYDFRFATGYVFRGESHPFWEMVYVGDGAVDILSLIHISEPTRPY